MISVVHKVYKRVFCFMSLLIYFVVVNIYICVVIYIKCFIVSHSGYLNWRRVCRFICLVSPSLSVVFSVVAAMIVMAACVFGSVEAFYVKKDKLEL